MLSLEQFRVGDRVTEDLNSPNWDRKILPIRTGRIVAIENFPHCSKIYPKILWDDDGSETFTGWEDLQLLPLEPPCSDILTYSQESEGLRLPQKVSEGYALSNLSKSIPMPKQCCDRTTQISQFTQTSEIIPVQKETLTSSVPDSLVPTHLLQETEQESKESLVHSGLKPCELLENATQLSLSLRISLGYSIEEWERSCKAYPKAGTWENGRLLAQAHLERPTKEKDYLSLPTLTACSGATSRPSGQTDCEVWFRQNGLLTNSQCLNPQMMAQLLGFPKDWTKCLWESKEVLGADSEVDSYSVEPLYQPVQPLPLDESCISIPASSENEKLPLEQKSLVKSLLTQEDEQWLDLYDRIAKLELERDLIRSSGPLAVVGVWIEYGKVSKKKFRQAYFRSRVPIFQAKGQAGLAKSESGLVKRSYIGEENSKAVKAASESVVRRNRLIAIAKEIELIEIKLEE